MRVNLIAKKRGRLLTIDWTRVIIISVVICIIFGFGVNFFLMRNEINVLKQEINIIDEQLKIYLPKQKEYLNIEEKLKELKKEPELNISEYLWDQPLIELGYIIPPGSSLTGLEMDTDSISFKGKTGGSEKLLQLKERMMLSPLFKTVTITKIDKQKDIVFNIKALLVKGGN